MVLFCDGVRVDAATHHVVDVARERCGGESVALHVDDAAVVAHGGTGLGLAGAEAVDLSRGLVDEGQEHVEREFGMTADYVGGQMVAVVDEVAGPHGGQVEVATGFKIEGCDVGRHTAGHLHDDVGGGGVGAFDKTGDVAEVERSAFCEGLHGIEHAISLDKGLEHVGRCGAGGVDVDGFGMVGSDVAGQLGQGVVAHAIEVDVGRRETDGWLIDDGRG